MQTVSLVRSTIETASPQSSACADIAPRSLLVCRTGGEAVPAWRLEIECPGHCPGKPRGKHDANDQAQQRGVLHRRQLLWIGARAMDHGLDQLLFPDEAIPGNGQDVQRHQSQ